MKHYEYLNLTVMVQRGTRKEDGNASDVTELQTLTPSLSV